MNLLNFPWCYPEIQKTQAASHNLQHWFFTEVGRVNSNAIEKIQMQDCQGLSGCLLLGKNPHNPSPSSLRCENCHVQTTQNIYIFTRSVIKRNKEKEKEKLNRKKSSKHNKKTHSPLCEWQQSSQIYMQNFRGKTSLVHFGEQTLGHCGSTKTWAMRGGGRP